MLTGRWGKLKTTKAGQFPLRENLKAPRESRHTAEVHGYSPARLKGEGGEKKKNREVGIRYKPRRSKNSKNNSTLREGKERGDAR